MSYFDNNKWTSWIIALLVLLNIGTLSTIWLRPGSPPSNQPVQLLQEALQLNEQQSNQFKTLRDQHFGATRELQNQLMEKKREMIRLLTESPTNGVHAHALTAEIGQLHQQLDSLLIDHFTALQAICQPEQQRELGELFLKSMEKRPSK
ncbi:MAG: periplasmic heavy metal sensor [Bacteroidota bacterium]